MILLDSKTVTVGIIPVNGGWITLASHADPQGEWEWGQGTRYLPENAYNGTVSDGQMAMSRVLSSNENYALYGDYWSGWLELYLETPTYCDSARAYYHIGGKTAICNIELQIKVNGVWQQIYSGRSSDSFMWHVIDFALQKVEGVRIRFERYYPPLMDWFLAYDVYEIELGGHSG